MTHEDEIALITACLESPAITNFAQMVRAVRETEYMDLRDAIDFVRVHLKRLGYNSNTPLDIARRATFILNQSPK